MNIPNHVLFYVISKCLRPSNDANHALLCNMSKFESIDESNTIVFYLILLWHFDMPNKNLTCRIKTDFTVNITPNWFNWHVSLFWSAVNCINFWWSIIIVAKDDHQGTKVILKLSKLTIKRLKSCHETVDIQNLWW